LNLPIVIARHYLKQQKGAFSFITKLAIASTALSVAVMLITLAVVAGFEEVITQKLYSFNGHIHIAPFDPTKSVSRTEPPIAFNSDLLFRLKKLPHVHQAFAFAERPVIVQVNGSMEGVLLKGTDASYTLPQQIALSGSGIMFPDSGYSRDIVLSRVTASKLNIKLGDTVQLQFFDAGSMPRVRKARVSALYHTGMQEVDQNFALCDIRLIQRLNNWTLDSINAYQIDLDNADMADTIATLIHYNYISPPLEALTTTENYPGIFDWLRFQKIDSTILLVIMAIVAIINMGAVLVIMIVDRTVMIALLKALGMTFQDTVKVFLSIGAMLGGTGILLGNIITVAFGLAQQHFKLLKLPEATYSMSYVPVKLVWWHLIATDIGCLVLLTVCMWLPALYIRTIQPAKALQFR
jgi:lipoprotein-releasing system permease protein